MQDYQTEREDGRYLSSLGFKQYLLRNHTPRLAFDPTWRPAEFPAWQERVRAKLRDLMRYPEPPPQPEPQRLWGEPRDGYRIEKWESYPEPGSVVPFLLLVPDGASAESPVPLVHCYPGSAHPKEWLAGEDAPWPGYPVRPHLERNDMARQIVRAGMAAIAVDNPGTGELVEQPETLGESCLGTGRAKLSQDLIAMGRNYVGLSAYQKHVILDWSRTLPYIRSDRIALSAHSLGTEPAMVLGVLEPDLAAVVSNDYLASQVVQEQHLGPSDDGKRVRVTIPLWHLIPDFWLWLDLKELLCAMAPTPLFLAEGGHWSFIEQVRQAYATAGSPAALDVHHYPAFADPSARITDGKPLPYGLTLEEYLLACNVDVPNHYYKGTVAIPWLQRQLLGA
jgi:hypothetical protein